MEARLELGAVVGLDDEHAERQPAKHFGTCRKKMKRDAAAVVYDFASHIAELLCLFRGQALEHTRKVAPKVGGHPAGSLSEVRRER